MKIMKVILDVVRYTLIYLYLDYMNPPEIAQQVILHTIVQSIKIVG